MGTAGTKKKQGKEGGGCRKPMEREWGFMGAQKKRIIGGK